MSVPSKIPVPSPDAIKKALFRDGTKSPPLLPMVWRAKVLVTPPGGVVIDGTQRDELFAGILTYDFSTAVPLLRAQLYALESLAYFDLLFGSDQNINMWWTLTSNPTTPDGQPNGIGTAVQSDVVVPTLDSISSQFKHAGSWNVVGKHSHGFSGKKSAQPSTWIWQEAESNLYRRIMNVDPSNDFAWPIFGSFYFVDFTTFEPLAGSNLPDIFGRAPKGAPAALMSIRTFGSLASVMASQEAEGGITCIFGDIQSILPGLEPGNQAVAPPQWTSRVQSQCLMIGQDSYPYYCQIWYDWNRGCQVTVFVQKDNSDDYNTRFDEFLPKGQVGPAIIYTWTGTEWDAACSQADGGFVPMPVPDFVKVGDGKCRASFKGSAYFGELSMWTVALGDQTKWSDFCIGLTKITGALFFP
jgi:hypothetical protein